MTYSSGYTFKIPDGWFAQWHEDEETGIVEGPFETEEAAAHTFLADMGGTA